MKSWYNALFLMIFIFTGAALAGAPRNTGDVFNMVMNITGTVVSNGSCTFNEQGESLIDFGVIKFMPVDGRLQLMEEHKKPLNGNMTCDGDISGNTQMKLEGTPGSEISWNNEKLLPTKDSEGKVIADLGIRLLVNGVKTDMGSWFDVDLTKPVNLEAELVQTGSGKDFFSGEQMNANATLTMAFN